jgi:hypothetical protein
MNFWKIKKITFALTLAFASVLGLSSFSTVQAQDRPGSQQRERDRMEGQRMYIMERSEFRDGFRRGMADARRGWRPNPRRHNAYLMGDRLQRRDFRMGYEQGYRRMFRRG